MLLRGDSAGRGFGKGWLCHVRSTAMGAQAGLAADTGTKEASELSTLLVGAALGSAVRYWSGVTGSSCFSDSIATEKGCCQEYEPYRFPRTLEGEPQRPPAAGS